MQLSSWGPNALPFQPPDIAQATYDYQEYPVVMSNVWKRVNEAGRNWRIVYKALSLLDYLIRNGSERAVEDGRDERELGRAERAHQLEPPLVPNPGYSQSDVEAEVKRRLLAALRPPRRRGRVRTGAASRPSPLASAPPSRPRRGL